MHKKRSCCICGNDLTKKNYTQVVDKETGKIVVCCPGRCAQKKMMEYIRKGLDKNEKQ